MNRRRIILLSVAPAVALGLIITLTVISTIPVEPTQPYIRIIEPKDGAEVSGITRVTIDYSEKLLPLGIQMFVDGRLAEGGGGTPPFILNWDTTWFTNGPHLVEFQGIDPYSNVTVSEKRFYNVNNPTYRKQDFIYEYNHSIDIGELAKEITERTGLELYGDNIVPVGAITSGQDPCGTWAKIKLHFYGKEEMKEAASYTTIDSILPLTQEQIEKIDSIAKNWNKKLEPSLQERTGRGCPSG